MIVEAIMSRQAARRPKPYTPKQPNTPLLRIYAKPLTVEGSFVKKDALGSAGTVPVHALNNKPSTPKVKLSHCRWWENLRSMASRVAQVVELAVPFALRSRF